MTCSVENCGGKVLALGMCSTHYGKKKKYIDEKIALYPEQKDVLDKEMAISSAGMFLSKVDFSTPTLCWEWTGSKSKKGYGNCRFDGKIKSAHRLMYELSCGEIGDGMHVLHKCDNPGCVRPSHLFLGTNQNNHDDKIKKGRQAKGEKIHTSRLTEDDIREIRSLSGYMTHKEIAKKYGVKKLQIHQIISRKNWGHVA